MMISCSNKQTIAVIKAYGNNVFSYFTYVIMKSTLQMKYTVFDDVEVHN